MVKILFSIFKGWHSLANSFPTTLAQSFDRLSNLSKSDQDFLNFIRQLCKASGFLCTNFFDIEGFKLCIITEIEITYLS